MQIYPLIHFADLNDVNNQSYVWSRSVWQFVKGNKLIKIGYIRLKHHPDISPSCIDCWAVYDNMILE